ncbi:MAG: ChbG/HpnK family deacetylase [Lachnospiraceae bacterium]|nr:ChbG/HpnK family deacetylase [Lachnospiraceae bacterium]
MKLIVRADDVGYTIPYNMGTEEAIRNGVVTSADLMLDCPGFEDAVERLKKYPFLSIGWHSHFWGKPVCDPAEVPSMVNEKGWFKFRKDQSLKDTCDYDEIVKECRAQVERCIRMLGKAPDYTHSSRGGVFETARRQVCDEYGIKYGFCTKKKPDGGYVETPSEEYASLGIYMVNQPATVYKPSFDDSMTVRKTYSPVKYYQSNAENMLSKEVCITAWHPGFLDDHILKESSCTEARIVDMIALCSEELKAWIKENHVELINYRDALYGTHDYQNHLKVTGSDLAVR